MTLIQRMGFLLPLSMPLLVVVSYHIGHWYLVPLVVYVLIPVLDRLFGDFVGNPTDSQINGLQASSFYSMLLYMYVPLQVFLLIWGVTLSPVQTWLQLLLLGWVVGIVTGGIGITVAHELGHRRSQFEQTLSCILLSTVSYMHFFVEHNKGHHSRVATDEDPASARFGESFYAFLPRTLVGGFMSAVDIEREKLQRLNRPFWCLENLVIWSVAIPLLIVLCLGVFFGAKAAVFFLVQSVTAVLLLETVNYIEHYGLSRERTKDGRYEKVTVAHSWNSNRYLSNALLFNLQRHSHHHVNVLRKYQSLSWFEDSPQLPVGYPELVVTAWIPPLWRRRIHPLIPA